METMKRDTTALDVYLNKLFEEKGYPGVAVCIRGPEGILYERGFGYRSIENQLPVDGDTMFGIASMSKSMTALACCILAVEGKMSLEDPVTKYFPDFHVPGAADECVTVRSLAMHRAGIPPMEPLEWSIAMNSVRRDSEWYRVMRKTSPNKMDKIEQIVDYITAGDYEPLGAPGEYMSYSNEGYALLSYIVDQAAGVTLEEFLMKRLFQPLGMTRTILDLDCSEAREIADGNITSLFERDDDKTLVWDDDWSVLPPFRGCACVKSTAKDITKYYQMLADGGRYEGRQIIPEEAVELLGGKAFPLRRKPFYCLGLWKSEIGGKKILEHSGGLHGVSTQGGLMEDEAGGYGIAALCNEGDVNMIPFQWACYNFLLGLPLETEHEWAIPSGMPFSLQDALCGEYLAREGMPCHTTITMEDGQLMAVRDDMKMELRYCEDTAFAVFDHAKPEVRLGTFRFYIRNGAAWAVKCGSRIHQRVK